MKDAVALTLLIVIMIFVPDGILGRAGRKGG
jgi:branched-chain amino acid transport system permease protein